MSVSVWSQSGNRDSSQPAVNFDPTVTFPSLQTIEDVATDLAEFVANVSEEALSAFVTYFEDVLDEIFQVILNATGINLFGLDALFHPLIEALTGNPGIL